MGLAKHEGLVRLGSLGVDVAIEVVWDHLRFTLRAVDEEGRRALEELQTKLHLLANRRVWVAGGDFV